MLLTADLGGPESDPWTIDRLVWPVLAVTQQAGGDPGLAALHRLAPGASRYAQARRVADLFDRYHLHRPAMVRSWAAGEDVDGSGRRVPDASSWQPHLWRLVRGQVGEPSPPERWPGLLERVAEGDLVLDLPSRLVYFGFTLLPGGGFLDLARAVARHRDVHLFLLEPSRFDPDHLRRTGLRPPDGGARLRADDSTAVVAEHPLLRSWGRLHREAAVLLADAEVSGLPEREWIAAAESSLRTPTPATAATTRPTSSVVCRAASEPIADQSPLGTTTPTTVPCSSTPALERPAKSRCCAMCFCTC